MRDFISGGNVSVPTATRTEVFSRALNWPAESIILKRLDLDSDSGNGYMTVEVIMNGATVHTEELFVSRTSSDYTLPFYRMQSVGKLQVFITHALGVASNIGANLRGYIE
jgi:hypothetical protein